MTFKQTCTKLLKVTVEGTKKTLEAINVEKIAKNVNNVKQKAELKLDTYKTILEEKLKEEILAETEIKERSVEELNLSNHTLKILLDNNIKYISELKALRDEDLMDIKGVGKKTFEEIKEALKNV